ncbi:MAG: hypothetical protein IJN87_01295 [Firmicutes bacterium]|nr:hypothetical protein [Bacillota bacterium]
MKKYEKPILNMLSLTGSEQLCGSCSNADIKLYNGGDIATLIGLQIGNKDGVLTRAEVENLFANAEDSCTVPYEAYCKFNGANTVAWS